MQCHVAQSDGRIGKDQILVDALSEVVDSRNVDITDGWEVVSKTIQANERL